MADNFKPAQLQPFTLAGSGAIIGATTITLTSFTTIDGTALAMSDFGSIGYGTIQPGGSTYEEQISFTGVTQNANGTATLTGVKTVLFLYPYTATSGLAKTHAGGSTFVISNTSAYYTSFAILNNNNAFTGVNSFTQNVTVPDPINNTDAANKEWVLTVVNGGAVTVSQLVIAGTAGETLVAGNPVYFKASDARWWKASGATASTLNNVQLGIAQGAGTAGNAITNGVLLRGVDTNQSGGSNGALGYISNTSTIATTTGTVEKAVGNFITATTFAFDPLFYYTPTSDLKAAMTPGGVYGTPSASNPFLTKDYNASATGLPVTRVYSMGANLAGATTQFDITNPAGTTFRYTFDGTGTNPAITTTSFPVGATVTIYSDFNTASSVMSMANQGSFTVTASGTDYFEVTNAGGVVESNKNFGANGYLQVATNTAWVKPAGLKYVVAEVVGGGGGGAGSTSPTSSGGGGGGGYARKAIAVASLGATEAIVIGGGGRGGLKTSTRIGATGGTTSFGSHISATGGVGGNCSISGGFTAGGAGGLGASGDVNINGGGGSGGTANITNGFAGMGGSSYFGGGAAAPGAANASVGLGFPGKNYGGGGSGTYTSGADVTGYPGGGGVLIITEYYS